MGPFAAKCRVVLIGLTKLSLSFGASLSGGRAAPRHGIDGRLPSSAGHRAGIITEDFTQVGIQQPAQTYAESVAIAPHRSFHFLFPVDTVMPLA